ncbi:MAG: peptidase [Proteobacteria bacterium]|nr:peptidase [Pseudomonadota bacterium]
MMHACDKFAPIHLSADISSISPEDRVVLSYLVQAAKRLDDVYLRQVSPLNPQFKQEIEDTGQRKLIDSYRIMGGPWDRLDAEKPFYGSIEKPPGAGFYPSDITQEEFRAWIAAHPQDEADFLSCCTIIRRQDNELRAIPYSKAYAHELEQAAELLQTAAEHTTSASLKHYLNARAKALGTNDYAESDAAWIALEGTNIEFVFGPYETYEDKLFGYKAAFEAFIGYRDAGETARLKTLSGLLPQMQQALPIDDALKATQTEHDPSPFLVMNLLTTAGEARYGVQTLAFVLPNDPEVIRRYGTKKVMMRNVQEAKFGAILKPIAERFVAPGILSDVSFSAFFRHTILHETAHSLGPKAVQSSTYSIQHHLAESYAPIEECKADATANFLAHWQFEQGELSEAELRQTYATMIAGFFRSMRFGLNQAHARANAIQLNFLLERGGIVCDAEGLFNYDYSILPGAIADLVAIVMNLEYEGDAAKAADFLARYAVLDAALLSRLTQLHDIPIDIAPHYDADQEGFFEENA